MIYTSSTAWRNAAQKRILLFGMSGLGKTHISKLLRDAGTWFHYSVDYRIGTRYMGEHITDNFKREAMKVPFLRDLLMSDSVYISSNLTFDNLAPLSTYLGKPGNPGQGGLPFADYRQRQQQHCTAEIAALYDTVHFMGRSVDLYGYDHFICDSGGSICEVVDPFNPEDPLMRTLSANFLPVWIKGTDDHTAELIRRFDRAPKPMYYQPAFLQRMWGDYQAQTGLDESQINPDAFIRWTYAKALAHRQPRYEAMAQWGVTLPAQDISGVRSPEQIIDLIAAAIDARADHP